MGNKFIRHRVVVDERYTRPQGLYESKEGDYRKLRRLILNGQLAPCFPGAEESLFDLEECPICFLFYPSLNRSKCCSKGICTECYLQMKSLYAGRLARCPFCKTPGYMVEYRGAKTVEEKGFEQAEEQKVIEAKIRIRQKELHEEENRKQRREEGMPVEQSELISRSERGEYLADSFDLGTQQDQPGEPSASRLTTEEGRPLSPALIASMQEFYQQTNRNDSFDLDMDDIMLMEAIWLSIQEQGGAPEGPSGLVGEDHTWAPDFDAARGSRGRSGAPVGFAGAIAALAERQVVGAENGVRPPESTARLDMGNLSTELNNDWVDVSRESSHLLRRGSRSSNSDHLFDHSSEVVEVGTSFSSSLPDVPWEAPDIVLPQNIEAIAEPSLLSGQVIPETFEEQMMLVMALSLAEAQTQARR